MVAKEITKIPKTNPRLARSRITAQPVRTIIIFITSELILKAKPIIKPPKEKTMEANQPISQRTHWIIHLNIASNPPFISPQILGEPVFSGGT